MTMNISNNVVRLDNALRLGDYLVRAIFSRLTGLFAHGEVEPGEKQMLSIPFLQGGPQSYIRYNRLMVIVRIPYLD